MAKDWEARFRVPPRNDRFAIITALTLFLIAIAPLFFPFYIFAAVGLLPALGVRFVMRKLGRAAPGPLGVVGIAVGVWILLVIIFLLSPASHQPIMS